MNPFPTSRSTMGISARSKMPSHASNRVGVFTEPPVGGRLACWPSTDSKRQR